MGAISNQTSTDKLREDVDKLSTLSPLTTSLDGNPDISSPYQIRFISDISTLVGDGWEYNTSLNELYKDNPTSNENVTLTYPSISKLSDKTIKGIEFKTNCYVATSDTTKYQITFINPNTIESNKIVAVVTFNSKELMTLKRCKTDLGDLRVFNNGTSIPYYLDTSTINTEETKLYVLTPTIPANGTLVLDLTFDGSESSLTTESTRSIYTFVGVMASSSTDWTGNGYTFADSNVVMDTTNNAVSFGLNHSIDIPNNTIISFDYYSPSELKFNFVNSDRIMQMGTKLSDGMYMFYMDSSWAWINGAWNGDAKPNGDWNSVKIIRYNNTLTFSVNGKSATYTSDEMATKFTAFKINWYFDKGNGVQKIKNFLVQNYVPQDLTSTVSSLIVNAVVPMKYPNFIAINMKCGNEVKGKYITTKWSEIDYVDVGGASDLWGFSSDTILKAILDGTFALELQINGGIDTTQAILKYGVINIYFESAYTDEADAILNRLKILGITINKCDKWLEIAKPEIAGTLTVQFTKQYLEVPSINITTSKSGYDNHTIDFITKTDNTYGLLYTGAKITFNNYTVPIDKVYANITIIGRAL